MSVIKKPFYGYDKQKKERPYQLTYEVWENFYPDKIAGGQFKKYVPGILSEEHLNEMIPFWKELALKFSDPVLSLQLDKDGGSTVMYQYSDDRKGPPPNAKGIIIKPIFQKNIGILKVAEEPGISFVFHTSLNSTQLESDINSPKLHK